ncbi:MAG: DUF3048 domain-containing protein [Actinobacteria bacterium]|nr:DUF3048 domain-containing protein [Actinomycetota bacterium]
MRRSFLATVLALAVALAACGGGGDDETEKKAEPKNEEEVVAVAPLTGLPDLDDTAQTRPALTVKVDNICEPGGQCVRPQTGVDQADVVYEEVTEGGITRFTAIFQSQVPPEVGPIRSVRAIDPDLVAAIGGVFAYSGGAGPNVEKVRQAPVNAIDENAAGDAMFRNDAKEAPHNLFGRPQALFDKGGQPVPPPPLFEYLAEGEVFAGETVTSFRVGFRPGYAPNYAYDAATRTWKRDIDGVPFTMSNLAQIAPTNVIVQFTQYTGGGEGNVIGEGVAWIFSDGKLIRGTWSRAAREETINYFDAAGQPVKLLPGSTWVELLPNLSPVDLVGPPPAPATPST